MKKHFFYDRPVLADREQEYIQNLLKKYSNAEANEELKQKIWDELQTEKQLGRITIPFKLALRRDPTHQFPNYVEVILDTKL